MTGLTVLADAGSVTIPDGWYFPSLYVTKSDEDIEKIVDAVAGKAEKVSRMSADVGHIDVISNGERRATVRLCLQFLADFDGSFAAWLRETSDSFPVRLNPRYERLLSKHGLSLPTAKSRGHYRFAYELEVQFLSEMGFSAEMIASLLSQLLKLHSGPHSGKEASFLRQAKSAISRRWAARPDLSAASKVLSRHAGVRRGAEAIAKASKD